MSDFARTMKRLRLDAGIGLRALARTIPADPGHLSRIETGGREPTPDLALAIDRALHAGGCLAVLAPPPDQLDRTARESERLAALLAATPSQAGDDLERAATALAVDYLSTPATVMLDEAAVVRRQAVAALRRTRRPTTAVDITRSIGQLSGVLAYAAVDLGDPAAAMAHADAAWHAAEATGDDQQRAWVRGTQSLIARFDGRYVAALRYAEDGLRYAGTTSAKIRLLCGVAQCAANLGDQHETHKALHAAAAAREHVNGQDEPGLFGFSEAKQAYYSGSSLIWLPGRDDAALALDEARRAIALWSASAPDERSLDDEALAHVYAGTAAVHLRDVGQAGALLEPILGLPEDRRISWIRKRLLRVADLLNERPFVNDGPARELRERIVEYR